QDIEMYSYLKHYGLDGLVVATKADKISRNQIQKQVKLIRDTLKLSNDDKVIPVSSLKRTGYDVLLDEMGKLLEE
ncbi:MAG: YihA family ribosome biogenesis GTP-binding protein, partial [Firmicutes bacterium]|nr:YihA family ribosome biogenesis GTP-binding protein [Bacillota bacterium]